MTEESLLEVVDPYRQAAKTLQNSHRVLTSRSNVLRELGELSDAFRSGIAEALKRTTKHFNEGLPAHKRERANHVMEEIFGESGWWAGTQADDGSGR